MVHDRDAETKHEGRQSRRARAADIIGIGFVLLAAFTAFHPIEIGVLGIPLRIRRWWRPLLFGSIVVLARCVLAGPPPEWSRTSGPLARVRAWAEHQSLPHVLALGLPSLLSLAIVIHGYDGNGYLPGDCSYYYWTALALLRDHGLDLSRQLPGGWQAHINQVSLSMDLRPVSKHPVVMPLISMPFIAVFGKPGALIFNLVQITVLLEVIYRLALLLARPVAASAAVVATFAGSMLPHYVWNYSPDLCATMLLLSGTWLVVAGRRSSTCFAGGFLLGAACVAKFPLLLYLPGSLLLRRPDWRSALSMIGGLAIPLGAFAVMNLTLFGSPLVTSYDRIATLTSERQPAVYSQRSSFSLPIAEGARGQLFDPEHGLLPTSPVTVLAVLGIPLWFVRRPRLAAHLTIASLILFCLFSTYDQWNASHYGNRFLLPIVAAFALPLAAALDPLVGGWAIPRRTGLA